LRGVRGRGQARPTRLFKPNCYSPVFVGHKLAEMVLIETRLARAAIGLIAALAEFGLRNSNSYNM